MKRLLVVFLSLAASLAANALFFLLVGWLLAVGVFFNLFEGPLPLAAAAAGAASLPVEDLVARAMTGVFEISEAELNALAAAGARGAAPLYRFELDRGLVRVSTEMKIPLNLPATPLLPRELAGKTVKVAMRTTATVEVSGAADELALAVRGLRFGRFDLPREAVRTRAARLIAASGLPDLRFAADSDVFLVSLKPLLGRAAGMLSVQELILLPGKIRITAGVNSDFLRSSAPALRTHVAQHQAAVEAAVKTSLTGIEPVSAGRFFDLTRELLALAGAAGTADRPGGFAVLAYFENQLSIEDAGRPASPVIGLSLGEKAVLTTGAASSAELVLPDASIIRLGERTIVQLDSLHGRSAAGRHSAITLLNGKLRAVVGSSKSRTAWDIRTAGGVLGVRGTDFGAVWDRDGRRLTAFVLEGRVAIDGGLSAVLAAGREASLGAGARPRLLDLSGQRKAEIEKELPVRTSPEEAERRLFEHDARRLYGLAGQLHGVYEKMNENARRLLNREAGRAFDADALLKNIEALRSRGAAGQGAK